MKSLSFNRFISAAAKTLAIFGTIHLAILFWLAAHGHPGALNAFAILNLNLILPDLGDGEANFALSWVVVLVVYGYTLLFMTEPGESRRGGSRL